MPRKTRTPESLALNRENQRRSRARQRELLDDLQNRVREFERRDGQATLEMQRVARAVAGENAALRGLLAAKGVSIEEVEAHVEAVRHGEKMVARTGVATVTPVSTPSSNASPVVIASRPMPCSQPQGCAPVRENSNPPFAIQPKMYSPPTPATTATSCTEESGCCPRPQPASQPQQQPGPQQPKSPDKIHFPSIRNPPKEIHQPQKHRNLNQRANRRRKRLVATRSERGNSHCYRKLEIVTRRSKALRCRERVSETSMSRYQKCCEEDYNEVDDEGGCDAYYRHDLMDHLMALGSEEDEDGVKKADERPGGDDAQKDTLIPLWSGHLAQGEASDDSCAERDAEKDCYTGCNG
ncbi:hypothetical protein NOF04DRAFT_1356732 [Fusarium oxysporum II5]|nr:hypothetical protein NOF04DRAFT_1356732 [Fusarium oxysporum II5]